MNQFARRCAHHNPTPLYSLEQKCRIDRRLCPSRLQRCPVTACCFSVPAAILKELSSTVAGDFLFRTSRSKCRLETVSELQRQVNLISDICRAHPGNASERSMAAG